MTWLLAVMLLPLAGAAVVTQLRGNDQLALRTALGVSLATLALVAGLWASYDPGGERMQQTSSVAWIPRFGIHLSFGIDGIALLMIAAIALLVPMIIGVLGVTDRLPAGRSAGGYLSLILVQQALTFGVFAATDVFLFYVLFEVMLVPMYFLIGAYGGPRRQYAAVKFFLYSFFGGLIMLASVIGAYVVATDDLTEGTFDWAALSAAVSQAPLSTQIWLFLGFFLAFAIKAPLVPLHTWLPDATSQAPIGVAVLLVGVLDKVGTFGFLRYCIPMFPAASVELAPLVLTLAVAGVLYCSVLAAGQADMKRFVAYVSIAHFGFIALGIFAFTAQAQVGSVTYMLNHSLATGMLIFVVGMIIARGGSSAIADYGGMAKLTPVLGGMMLVAGLAALALPGTNAFISEFLVLLGAFETRPAFAAVAAIGMILAAVYVLWLYQRVMQGPVRGNALVGAGGGPGTVQAPEAAARKAISDVSRRELAVLVPLVVLIIGLGLYPKPVIDVATPTVEATVSVLQEGDPR